MWDSFCRANRAFLRRLAGTWEAQGWQAYFLADRDGRWLWPPVPVALSPEAIVHELPPAGWEILPLCVAGGGFIGCSPVTSHGELAAQALLLEQLLSRELELEAMAGELAEAYDQLVAMYRVSEATRSQLSLHDILSSFVLMALRLSGAVHGFAVILYGQEFRCIMSTLPSGPEPVMPLFQQARLQRRSILGNAPRELRQWATRLPAWIERGLIIPIAVEGEIVAGLGLFNKATDFTSGDLKLLDALANEVGVIVERARWQARLLVQERVRRELEIAAEIQARMLPRILPQVPGLEISAHCRPANEVGGDFYDFVRHPGGALGVVLGDVTGKGVPAALFVTVAHILLHSGLTYTQTPYEMVLRLNSDLYEELNQAGMFITLFLAYYYAESRRLVMVNAGHAPVLLYSAAQKRCKLCIADGPPLGVLPQILSFEQTVVLTPGDILVVLSDGFNEMMNPQGELFGIDRLIELVESNADTTATDLRMRLFKAVTSFAQETPQGDDLTLCILKATAE